MSLKTRPTVCFRRFYVKRNSITVQVQCFDNAVFPAGSILGCDFVGTVTKLGDGVSRLGLGDTIAGLIWGGRFSN